VALDALSFVAIVCTNYRSFIVPKPTSAKLA
jgi:hypothetical protein